MERLVVLLPGGQARREDKDAERKRFDLPQWQFAIGGSCRGRTRTARWSSGIRSIAGLTILADTIKIDRNRRCRLPFERSQILRRAERQPVGREMIVAALTPP